MGHFAKSSDDEIAECEVLYLKLSIARLHNFCINERLERLPEHSFAVSDNFILTLSVHQENMRLLSAECCSRLFTALEE